MPRSKGKVSKKRAVKKKSRTPKKQPTTVEPISPYYLITKRFKTAEAFSQHIIETADQRNLSYMEMMLDYCSEHLIEPAAVAGLITKELKLKIEEYARRLHLLK
jgi:hypothetical protein